MTIKSMFGAALIAWGVLAVMFMCTIYQVSKTQAMVGHASDLRYHSYLLASELRQSSEDLTRLARTYVVTGDPKYEQQYQEILDVRGGKKPRPDGRTVALTELMKHMGFSDQEFAKLKESQDDSNNLVNTEIAAMNAVKGIFDDGSGSYTRRGEPDQELARKLMHDDNYHHYKAQIMKPLDAFFVLLDQRTNQTVEHAEASSRRAFVCAVALLILSVTGVAGAFLFMYRRISAQLGAEPIVAQAIVSEIARGNLTVTIELERGDRTSLLFAMKSMRDSLADIIGGVRATTETVAGASIQIAGSSQDLSLRTEQQASSLEETASSMEELTSTVRQSADNARRANQLALAASAANEIKQLIVNSVEKVELGSGLVRRAGETMDEIVDSVRKVTDIMGEITAATHEQSSGIEQINGAISQMDQVTQQNAALVEETAAAAEAMRRQADRLSELAGVFRLNERTNETSSVNSTRAFAPVQMLAVA